MKAWKLPYDPLRDFEFIALFLDTPSVLVANTSLPAKSVKELIDYISGSAPDSDSQAQRG